MKSFGIFFTQRVGMFQGESWIEVRALELSKFMSPVGKPDLFGEVDPRDARQGAAPCPRSGIISASKPRLGQ